MSVDELESKTEEARADSLIVGKRTEDVLREVADGTIAKEDALEVARALVRRFDRKAIARDNRKAADGG